MTGYELTDAALSLLTLSRAQAPEYTEFALGFINMLLCETNGANNTIRLERNKPELETPPVLASLDDEVISEPELFGYALPCGLCAKFILDDGDMARTAYFQNEYVNAVNSASRGVVSGTSDVYRGDGE